jgi:hypothetical protein
MNEKGAGRWLKLMVETLNESEALMANDDRVRVSINTFLSYFMEKYATEFGFKIDSIFGPTNAAITRKINLFNMTDDAIEALSEVELRGALVARRAINIDEHATRHELIQKAKSL